MKSRILAAADVMDALVSSRPHRGPLALERAVAYLETEVANGRLDREAVACVVAAAGGGRAGAADPGSGPLTERERQVFREIATGSTNREVAEKLFISTKTVGRHVENIYAKTGVTTRAGAAVYAMEHGMLGTST
jgi:DNA-binding NarL/FixJ family response regulator